LANGEKIAIILLDTQGAFDSQSTVRDCATVFALSTLLSSIQVYNISTNLQEDNLMHLHFFTEYGRLALERELSSPFQVLQFLIRDWQYPYEFAYGASGGEQLIAQRLSVVETHPLEVQQIRRHIGSCFQEIRCFLMPHPGFQVSQNPNFRGCIGQIEPSFVEQMQTFVPLLLSVDNLRVKEINGNQLDGRALLEFFKRYIAVYRNEEIPEPRSVLQATIEANNLAAVAGALEVYRRSLLTHSGDWPWKENILLQFHQESSYQALQYFDNIRKFGGDTSSVEYRDRLICKMTQAFEVVKAANEKAMKNKSNINWTAVAGFGASVGAAILITILKNY
jgi:atlastin